jgi:hypothetical protein
MVFWLSGETINETVIPILDSTVGAQDRIAPLAAAFFSVPLRKIEEHLRGHQFSKRGGMQNETDGQVFIGGIIDALSMVFGRSQPHFGIFGKGEESGKRSKGGCRL